MQKLTREDLLSLEQYSNERKGFKTRVMGHKQLRRLPIGPNATLYFEDRMTIHYQVQEMLRIERIFEADAIQEELDAYNPLMPDGRNWKATFMIEFEDPEQRRRELAKMVGIEATVWLKVNDNDPVQPICNEDLERSTEDKTSSVHFMRFELTDDDIRALKQDAGSLSAGISHEAYQYTVDPVPADIRDALLADLD